MPTYSHIERYYAKLAELIERGGSVNEQSIRPAFQACLNAYCEEHKDRVTLVPELPFSPHAIPDGTVKDVLRMARGYWEAKDTHDNLDDEIERKFNQGYPRDNIIFEDSQTAVLFQKDRDPKRVDMSHPDDLHDLIRKFLDFEPEQIGEFRQAQQQFKEDLPTVLRNLLETIKEAEAHNADYRAAVADFLDLCRRSIGPAVSARDVRDMLLQHILTKDIFLSIFREDQFHKENNVAKELEALEETFFTGSVRREAIERLRSYYGAIGNAANDIADYAEKQQFLKAIYEDFYKAYDPKAADRMGVVYTPNEVVDFIIRGTDHLLQKHFGRTLADDDVQILDPSTGTGTFITNLIKHLPSNRLEYKYLNEIHANEMAILPYYIANLNIEYTYKERTGRYLEFPNLCFVDTLDNTDGLQVGASGGAVVRQSTLSLDSPSEDNWIRIQAQNKKSISVIMGNPPYNANQQNENDNNKNSIYPEIDRRIKESYVKASKAQKTKQYDMYKRFIRWASDRLTDDGVVAFITNRAYLDARQDDGFRKVASQEFTDIYVLDLGSDVRRNPKISGTTHNVFGIQTGVAIGFFVREKAKLGECRIHYAFREDNELAGDKLAYLGEAMVDRMNFTEIMPDAKNNWLNKSSGDLDSLMPLVYGETKRVRVTDNKHAMFALHSLGVSTNRDGWVYDYSISNLRNKALFFADTYNEFLNNPYSVDTTIKWSETIRAHLRRGQRIVYNEQWLTQLLYRPFVLKHYFADAVMSDRLTSNHYDMFGRDLKSVNKVIAFSGMGSSKLFQVLATQRAFGLDLLEKTQCLPLYRYTEDGERVSNITDWGLEQVNAHYRKAWGEDFHSLYPDGISAEDIFAYTYAVLHDPVYRHDYEADLKQEFPRLPLYKDFTAWARMGQELLDLHIGFESADPYPLARVDTGKKAKRTILRADKDSGRIVLDDVTTLTGVPADAWRYRLGNRSALEWVLDQYKERKPKDPTIAEKFNTYKFADYKQQVIDLLRRVCTVSVRTMDIVDDMAYWDGDNLVVFGDRDKMEWSLMGLHAIFSHPEDPEWEAAWSET